MTRTVAQEINDAVALMHSKRLKAGPLYAEEDESGVVHLSLADGTPYAMMSRAVFEQIRAAQSESVAEGAK